MITPMTPTINMIKSKFSFAKVKTESILYYFVQKYEK